MFEQDTMTMTILPDGTIKTVTDPVSGANHDSAEQFLRDVALAAGGETTREARGTHGHAHHHHHDEHTGHSH